MRKGMSPKFIFEGEQFLGVCLSADYTTEHEVGIKVLQQKLGVTPNALGIERRRINNPKAIIHQPEIHLIACTYSSGPADHLLKDELSFRYKLPDIAGAWSDVDFGVRFSPAFAYLEEELWAAIEAKDAALISTDVFNDHYQAEGLNLIIISRLPAEIVAALYESDTDTVRLHDADLATGLAARLKAAKKEYFALAPRWAASIKSLSPTAYSVAYWLNPMDQKNNKAGYFTVEELEQWIEGFGPVPMHK
jgi:hypothetical protein